MGRDDARAAGLWSDQLVVPVVSGAAESDVDVGQFSPSGFGWHGPGSLPGNPVGRSDVFHPASHQPSPREGVARVWRFHLACPQHGSALSRRRGALRPVRHRR